MDEWRYARRTSGCALIMACRLDRCGSSVYVQKKRSCSFSLSSFIDVAAEASSGLSASPLCPRCVAVTVVVAIDDDMFGTNARERCGRETVKRLRISSSYVFCWTLSLPHPIRIAWQVRRSLPCMGRDENLTSLSS